MSMNLFLGAIHCLRPSLPLARCLSTALASPNAPAPSPSQASPPNPHLPVVDYLVQSCGLSPNEALKASKFLKRLKFSDKFDAVLRYLREIGISEEDIRAMLSRDARILCSSVENNVKPSIEKLLEVGFSMADISGILSRKPYLFNYNFAPKIDFWMQVFGSTEILSVIIRKDLALINSSLEKVLLPNMSFLKDECGFSTAQIFRLIKSNPRAITAKPEVLREQAERVDQLGIPRSSKMFVHALIICGYMTQEAIDSKLKNLRNLGLSEKEVTHLIRTLPPLLSASEEKLARKIELLTKEAGCDIAYVIQNPYLLTVSLEKRLIPRTAVLKLLKSKELPPAYLKLGTIIRPSEDIFLKRFVLPYAQDIPRLYQAYTDAMKQSDD